MKKFFVILLALSACGGKIASDPQESFDDAGTEGTDAHRYYSGYGYVDAGDIDTSPGIPLGDWPCLACPKPTGSTHMNR